MKEYLYYYFDPKHQMIKNLPIINSYNTDNTVINITDINSLITLIHNARTPSTILFDETGLADISKNLTNIKKLRHVHLLLVNSTNDNYLSINPANWQVISLLAQGTIVEPEVDLTNINISYPHKESKSKANVNKQINAIKSNNAEADTSPEVSASRLDTAKAANATVKPKAAKKKTKQKSQSDIKPAKAPKVNPKIAVALPSETKDSGDNEKNEKNKIDETSNAVNTNIDTKPISPKPEKDNSSSKVEQTITTEDKTKASDDISPIKPTKESDTVIFSNSKDNTSVKENSTINTTTPEVEQGVVFGNNPKVAEQKNIIKPDTNEVSDAIIPDNDATSDNTSQTVIFSNKQDKAETSNQPDTTVKEQNIVQTNNTPVDDEDFLAETINSKPKKKDKPQQPKPTTDDDGVNILEDTMKKMKF